MDDNENRGNAAEEPEHIEAFDHFWGAILATQIMLLRTLEREAGRSADKDAFFRAELEACLAQLDAAPASTLETRERMPGIREEAEARLRDLHERGRITNA